MTMAEFVQLLKSVDPQCTKTKGSGNDSYTTWDSHTPITADGDNTSEVVGYRIQVDRFSKSSDDPLAVEIQEALLGLDDVAVNILPKDWEQDTKYHHWIWDCEVMYG